VIVAFAATHCTPTVSRRLEDNPNKDVENQIASAHVTSLDASIGKNV
jgi:hypothetical protein